MIHMLVFFLMIRRPPRSTLDRSSAASDVYKRQIVACNDLLALGAVNEAQARGLVVGRDVSITGFDLSLIHISEPTRPY